MGKDSGGTLGVMTGMVQGMLNKLLPNVPDDKLEEILLTLRGEIDYWITGKRNGKRETQDSALETAIPESQEINLEY